MGYLLAWRYQTYQLQYPIVVSLYNIHKDFPLELLYFDLRMLLQVFFLPYVRYLLQMQAANQFIVNMTDLMGALAFQNGMQSRDMLVMNDLVWDFTDTSFDAHPSLHLVDIL